MIRRGLLPHTRMEILLTLRRGESLLATIGIPVGVLVFFASVDVVETGFEEPTDFLVPGVLALSVIAAAMVSLGIATGFERRYGALKRLGATPLGRQGLVVAKIAGILVVLGLQVAVVVVAGWLLGWRGEGADWAPAAGVVVLGALTFAGLGLLMAGTLRAELTLALTNGLYVAFILLGGIAVPLDRLPGPVEMAAKFTPAAQLAEALRGALTADPVPGWALVGLVAWAVTAPIAAAHWFRWEE